MFYIDSFFKIWCFRFIFYIRQIPSEELRLTFASFCWLSWFHRFVRKTKGRVDVQHPLRGPPQTLPQVRQNGMNRSTLKKPSLRIWQVVCVKLYTCVLRAPLSASASTFTSEWKKKSWVKETEKQVELVDKNKRVISLMRQLLHVTLLIRENRSCCSI